MQRDVCNELRVLFERWPVYVYERKGTICWQTDLVLLIRLILRVIARASGKQCGGLSYESIKIAFLRKAGRSSCNAHTFHWVFAEKLTV